MFLSVFTAALEGKEAEGWQYLGHRTNLFRTVNLTGRDCDETICRISVARMVIRDIHVWYSIIRWSQDCMPREKIADVH
jgi:hypothetical protein